MPGLLIAFEGLDQSGKQTQAERLRDRLKEDGRKARLVSFPDYGTSIGEEIARALSNERRLQILDWLRRPRRHFPPQVDGDLIEDGVCGLLIARKLRVTQPTASEHLKILQQAGLIRGKRIKQWTFYKRDEVQIRSIKKQFLAKV